MRERIVLPPPRGGLTSPVQSRILLPLFAATMFLSATLLFAIQPMFAKMVLPLLGGSPGVWNTAMLFFQAVLLAGYAYAHLTARYIGLRPQLLLHMAVLVLAVVSLPIGIGADWAFPPTDSTPVPWLLGLLAASVGLPFFAVSATAPLLQRWFAHTTHEAAGDPYFLYAVSNLGSILALLGYPLVLELVFTLGEQSRLWTFSYALLTILIISCAVFLWRGHRDITRSLPGAAQAAPADRQPTWRERLHWLALAFVPSSLLLGVTTHLTTDVAAVPLLWVVPLALYLLTFVLVFARRPILEHSWMIRAQALLVIPLALLIWYPTSGGWINLLSHLAVFFVMAMVCHGEMVRRRPGPSRLTEFYFWMSAGGVLGGAFNALVAPSIFNSVYEYPLALALACLLRPAPYAKRSRAGSLDVVVPVAIAAAVVLWLVNGGQAAAPLYLSLPFIALVGFIVFSARERPLRFGLSVAAFLLPASTAVHFGEVIARERSFFGVHGIGTGLDGQVNFLIHGTTVHGAQSTDEKLRTDPLTYYTREGPFGQLFAALEAARRPPQRVGIVGLGVGALACYRRPEQSWTFFEIDPIVARIARDTRYFHYMADCAGDAPVVLGDGRLSLAAESDRSYDLLVFDAFSSDSIPVHLLTREALQLYLDKLTDGGLLAFHTSNRYLDVAGVVAAVAADSGLVAVVQRFHPEDLKESITRFRYPAEVVVVARTAEHLAPLTDSGRWAPLEPPADATVWTDDFSNLVSVLK